MAMLASKASFPTPLSTSTVSTSSTQQPTTTSRRALSTMPSSQTFSSPTESEFSDVDGPESSAKNWDEERVCDWLRDNNCGDYEKLFRKNNINGENLFEMDKSVLQEMGIEKIGDRVRLFLAIKKLRTRAYANVKKRNRVSPATLCTLFGLLTPCRTLLQHWTATPTLLHLLVHRDHHILAAESYQLLLPASDIPDKSKTLTHPPSQKTSQSHHHDQARRSPADNPKFGR